MRYTKEKKVTKYFVQLLLIFQKNKFQKEPCTYYIWKMNFTDLLNLIKFVIFSKGMMHVFEANQNKL